MPQQLKEGKYTIRMGEGNTAGIIKPLIPLNCIIDTDVGLIYLIKNEYRSDIFDIDYIDSFNDNRDLIKILYHRRSFNPLIPFLKNKEDIETADDLYVQFMTKEYKSVIKYSVFTGIYKLAYYITRSEEVSGTLAYANETDREIIDRDPVLKNYRTVYIKDIPDQCKGMDTFYFRSVADTYFDHSIPILASKNINILDYGFNFADDGSLMLTKETLTVDVTRCRFNIINAYNRKEIE